MTQTGIKRNLDVSWAFTNFGCVARPAGWLAVRSIKEYLASSLCACRGGIRRSFASCVILLFLPSPSSSNGFTSLLDSAQRRAAQYAVDITMLFISPMKASGGERERERERERSGFDGR